MNPDEPFDMPDPLETFDGVTRLFPLPNVVLFPGVLLPLHIFEPRYRQMVADALESNRLITMVLLKPGYESDYEGSPPIHDTGCLGHILHHEYMADGRSNLVLRGLCRVRMDREVTSDRLYRTARVTMVEDLYGSPGPESLAPRRQELHGMLRKLLLQGGRAEDAEKIAAIEQLPPGKYCDLVCHWLGLETAVKQTLLTEADVSRRIDTLLAWLHALLQTRRRRDHTGSSSGGFSPN